MPGKIVELGGANRREGPPPVSDFWFAQLDLRLGKIEGVVARLERQVWMIVAGALGLIVIEAAKAAVEVGILR